jgi:hypothetical protein
MAAVAWFLWHCELFLMAGQLGMPLTDYKLRNSSQLLVPWWSCWQCHRRPTQKRGRSLDGRQEGMEQWQRARHLTDDLYPNTWTTNVNIECAVSP